MAMTRMLLILPGALAACGAAGDDPPAARPAAPGPQAGAARGAPSRADCPLSVSFGSYAMGIDRPTLAAVEALLEDEAAVASVERQGWGREGEVTLCVRLADAAAAEPIARRIAALFPANPRGPLRVWTGSGYAFEAPRRER